MASDDLESMQRLITEMGAKPKSKKASCDHDYRHLSSKSFRESRYVRIDQFYCTRCLEIREVRREFDERPEWWT